MFICHYMLDYGFPLKSSYFDAMPFIHMFMHDAIGAELLQGK